MTPDRLLALYERTVEAPDATARMRRLVLDLAVRGKLVEQNPEDEPASQLIKRIAAEKAQLVKAGRIRPNNLTTTLPIKQQAFPIPGSWAWVPATFPVFGVSDAGKKIKTKDVLESGAFPVVDQGRILVRGYSNDVEKVIKVSAPIVVFGDHTREVKLVDFDFIVGADGVKLLRPIGVSPFYYYLSLQWLPLDSRGYGRHFKILKASAIPLPPLAEQHRIVAKVEELMALLDRLEAARNAREASRDRLTVASLARLTASETAEPFPSHARFALDNLPALTARPDQIKALRQTILNLAVRGKLVEQDPNDEPASELVKRIAEEKGQLVKAGKLKKPKPIWPIKEDELPFSLPSGWAWVRLGEIIDLVSGQHLRPNEYTEDELAGLPYITGPADFDANGLQIGRYALVQKAVAKKGQLLLTVKGSGVGKAAICDIDRVAISRQLMALTAISWSPTFLSFVAKGLATKLQEEARSLIPGISREDVTSFVVGLPPLAEQHRIVGQVETLMTLCSRLEGALSRGEATRSHLFKALLQEALTTSAAAKLEAAE